MKFIFSIIIFIFIFGCSNTHQVYWCGDHPCINNKEKEAYFKKTMTVEIRKLSPKDLKKSEIEKITEQAIKKENKRIASEKQKLKQAKIDKKKEKKLLKELEKEAKLEKKRKRKEEKKLKKLAKIKKKSKNKKISNDENKLVLSTDIGVFDLSKSSFDNLADKIKNKNLSRSYPNINDIPE